VRTLQVPGADLYTLQEKMGHADITTTREYLHMAQEALGERQRAFSPIDHLGLTGLMRQPSPKQAVGRLWHKRVDLGHEDNLGPQRPQSQEELKGFGAGEDSQHITGQGSASPQAKGNRRTRRPESTPESKQGSKQQVNDVHEDTGTSEPGSRALENGAQR
jgi:hypothetical protein